MTAHGNVSIVNLFFNCNYYFYRLIEWLCEARASFRSATSMDAIRKSRHASVRKYCAYNRETFSNSSRRTDRIILLDCFPVPQWVIANSFLLNKLSARLDASIVSYGITGRDAYADCLYRSFGCHKHLLVRSTWAISRERKRLFREILASVKTKNDLLNLEIDGVRIGLDVYESILRIGLPTIEVGTFKFKRHIFLALKYYLYFSELFASGVVKSVALSHDSYLGMGLIAKVAYRSGVPVYFANPFEIIKTVRPSQIYERLMHYPDYYSSLEDWEKERAVSWARGQLEKRVRGAVGVNMSYQEKSAFTAERIERQTVQSDAIKVVVATHCFFDNPHGLGWMLFTDFYEWLCFLGEISKTTNYEWYLKPHPDYLPGTLETLSRITDLYPNLRLIDPATTFHQLREEGVSIALTCYGSIGHELPLLGYRVINAAYNPHIAYRFNWHPKTVEEYRDILLNLQSLGDVQDAEKIFEFFYVNNAVVRSDDFLFESYEQFLADAGGDPLSVSAYEAFLSQKDIIRRKVDEKMDLFLMSGSTYFFELEIHGLTEGGEARRVKPICAD